MDFNSLYWHDATIIKIEIDRQDPGINDSISMIINWPNGVTNKILFENVYWASFVMNFGVGASESIRSASIIEDGDEDLANVYLKWKSFIGDMKLICYFIDTNSTNSDFKIIAKGFKVL